MLPFYVQAIMDVTVFHFNMYMTKIAICAPSGIE
jgi:hypothetical protein